MVQKSANTAFACQITWGCNFRANAVFTFFALYSTLFCTFSCTKFALSKFGVNPIFSCSGWNLGLAS